MRQGGTADWDRLDEIDRSILRLLERSGRMPYSDLAARVGIAESTCHKRVRALVASGAISGFHATVEPAVLGLTIEALISIRLTTQARSGLRRFQEFLEQLPATQRVYFVSGDRDFLVHVAVRDAQELRALVAENISVREEVAATNTSFVFEHARGRLPD